MNQETEKPLCLCDGVFKSGYMCSSIIVGRKYCGSTESCVYKLEPGAKEQK